jgi:phage pi2 protein 07
MDIKSIEKTEYQNGKWLLDTPGIMKNEYSLQTYVVQKQEDMRIDLVMQSIYEDISDLSDVDVLLYINNIDNPLNIREGMILYYPKEEDFDNYRFNEESMVVDKKSIKQQLGVLNKTTRIDEKRKKFLDADYSLPPVVKSESKPSVTIDSGSIKIGGL